MTRAEIDNIAMNLAAEEWRRLHEWFFGDRPLHHKDYLGDIHQTGRSNYAEEYMEYARQKGLVNDFRSSTADTLEVFGRTFKVS